MVKKKHKSDSEPFEAECSISDEVRIEELKIFSKSQNDYAQIKVCSSEIYEIGTNMINYSVSAE